MMVLTNQSMKDWLTMEKALEIVEEFFRTYRPGDYVMPRREMMQLPELDAVYVLMPSYSHAVGLYTLKLINEYRRNPELHGLNVASGLILAFNLFTGQVIGMMDSVYPTAMRTGAIGGVAAKYMSSPESVSVGLLGSGNQAWTQLMAVKTVRKIESVRIFSPRRESREKIAARTSSELGLEASAVDSPREALEDADIVITATNSPNPVLSGEWLDEGAHVTSLGALATRRELDETTFRRAGKIVADLKESVLREAGDIMQAISSGIIRAEDVMELHEVVKSGRNIRGDQPEITIMKSVGFASLDLYFASTLFKIAQEKGLGSEINLE
jgi:ornithine cyclodeaminase/alanine dehydrogenase-like protein (mu-crystallin family)